MAEIYRVQHNPVHSIKRDLKAIHSDNHTHEELLKALFESNAETKHGVAEVTKRLNELIGALEVASEKADKEEHKPKLEGQLKAMEEKLDKISQQSLQLIQVIVDLVKHLKGKSTPPAPTPPTYTGAYPLRPLR